MRIFNELKLTYLLGLGVALVSPTALASGIESAPQFLALSSDQASYAVGTKAVLMAYVQKLPDNIDQEVYLSASFDAQPINVVTISDSQSVSITPQLNLAGVHTWSVDVYLQDRRLAADYNQSIAFYNTEITNLQNALATETDPVKRAAIQAQISRDQGLITSAQAELLKVRRKVETDTLTINVAGARLMGSPVRSGPTSNAFSISVDRPLPNYHQGESAVFAVHVLTDFTGSDGVRENVIRATYDNNPMGVVCVDNDNFTSQTPAFGTGDVGIHAFQATMYTRSKAQSDSLRDAIVKAQARRQTAIVARDSATDPAVRAYQQGIVNDMTQVIAALSGQLESILVLVGTNEQDIQVLNP